MASSSISWDEMWIFRGSLNRFLKLTACSCQQLLGDTLQRIQFIAGDISSIILLEAINEEPLVSLVGRNECPCATTLAAACKPDTFLHNTAAQIGINQTLGHFLN